MAGNIEACLKKFIHHVDNLCKEDEPGGNGFWREFKELREIQLENKTENKFPAEEGKKECNIKKNRYKDIIPYDTQRVVLNLKNGENGTDYINASYILDTNGEKSYIASQGPLPHTVNDFWRMLWEQKVEIVFMVCKEEEGGRNKCQRYWAEEGETKTFGDIEVTLESKEEIFPDFLERRICAKCGDQIHRVKQFHYTGWPDHGIPRNSKEIYNMVGKMREERRLLKIPLVIHCSAGCGRTGTICAVDYAWTMLDQGKIAHGFSMFDIIKNIREQRQSMVQTPDQYEFVHLVVQSLCADWLEKFQEHDYANFNFGAEEGETEEVYYNTIGLYDNSTASDDLYQDIKTLDSSSKSDVPKKPTPTPRPPNLLVEVNNNDQKNAKVTKTKETTENLKTKKPPSKQSPVPQARSQNLPSKTSDSSTTVHTTQISVIGAKAASKQAPSKQAASKPPPSFMPPSPSSLPHANAHGNAVKNRTLEAVQIPGPKERTVQQTAKSKAHKTSSSEVPPSPSGEEYGIVVKSDKTQRLVSYPDASSPQLPIGKVATEKRDRAPQSPGGDGPALPRRLYGPEEAALSTLEPGTVSAIGGLPQSSATLPVGGGIYSEAGPINDPPAQSGGVYSEVGPIRGHPAQSGGVYSEVGPIRGHPAQSGGVYSEVVTVKGHPANSGGLYSEVGQVRSHQPPTNSHPPPSNTYPGSGNSGTLQFNSNTGVKDKFMGMFGRQKQPQSPKNEENTNGHFFRNHNIGFGHKVGKPKGPRNPKNGTWSTRL